ncbi:hypothetical protein ACFXTO_038161 [Malus domestica]
MTTIGIKVDELSRSSLLIQAFNQEGQRAMGIIGVEMTIGELKSSTLFHLIDARTSYNLFLGRPWIHENGLFTEAESHFADAKFYMDEDMKMKTVPKKQEVEVVPSLCKDDDKPAKPAIIKRSVTPPKRSNTPVFQYIPMSRRKNGQSQFKTRTSKADI